MDRSKVRLSSAIAALLLFFLPWIDLNCGATTLASQSGFQAAIGTVSVNSKLEDMADKAGSTSADKKDIEKSKDELGVAFLVLLGLLSLAGSVYCFVQTARGQAKLSAIGGKLALAALVFVLGQLVVGFPLDDAMEPLESKDPASHPAEIAAAMTVETSLRAWFYLALLAMAGAASEILEPLARKGLAKLKAPGPEADDAR